jgi:hypothetical protein
MHASGPEKKAVFDIGLGLGTRTGTGTGWDGTGKYRTWDRDWDRKIAYFVLKKKV